MASGSRPRHSGRDRIERSRSLTPVNQEVRRRSTRDSLRAATSVVLHVAMTIAACYANVISSLATKQYGHVCCVTTTAQPASQARLLVTDRLFATRGDVTGGRLLSAAFALAGRHCEDSRLIRISAAIRAAILRVVGSRRVNRVGVGNSGERDVHEPELQQLRRVGYATDANRDMRGRRRGRTRLCADRESCVATGRAVHDNQRQLQQRAACQRLRVDRRHLRRDHRVDVHGRQIKSGRGDLFGQCPQCLWNRNRRTNHGQLALDSPAMRNRIAVSPSVPPRSALPGSRRATMRRA